jgi:hypothetical protein
MRKLFAAVTVLLVSLGVAMAEDFGGVIKKVDGNKLTITKVKRGEKGKFEKGEDVTLTVADNVKVTKIRFNQETKKFEAGDALEGGLKNALVKEEAFVRVKTENDKITELGVGEGRKKKDN